MTTVPGGEPPGHLLTIFTLLWLVPLLAWRLHARWRRLTARQRISPRRTQIHLSLFNTAGRLGLAMACTAIRFAASGRRRGARSGAGLAELAAHPP